MAVADITSERCVKALGPLVTARPEASHTHVFILSFVVIRCHIDITVLVIVAHIIVQDDGRGSARRRWLWYVSLFIPTMRISTVGYGPGMRVP